MQLRYSFRLYPTPGQRQALARAFGCVRVVFNDGLRARETARMAGLAFPSSGELSKALITEAGLGLAPGSAFGPEGEGWLRWCFAARPEKNAAGLERLAGYLAR